MSDANVNKIKKQAEELVNLTIKEAKQLIDILKNDYGIEAATPVAVATAGMPTVAAEDKPEEKTIFDIVLKSGGASKLGVIKIVKNLLELGLKEAKETVDNAPATLKEGVPKEQAEKIKKELTDAGAEVELK